MLAGAERLASFYGRPLRRSQQAGGNEASPGTRDLSFRFQVWASRRRVELASVAIVAVFRMVLP